jgi:hypothetical protein
LSLTHDLGDGGMPENTWTFKGKTDSAGNFRAKVPRAPSGEYQAQVTALSHDTHSWVDTLDINNPLTFTK